MSDLTFFIHRAGSKYLAEVAVPAASTVGDLLKLPEVAHSAAAMGSELLVFLEDHDAPVSRDAPLNHRGGRIHLVRCRQVEVRIYFMHREACRSFAPGARLGKVKEWAVREFGVSAGDAIEHVLQIHGTVDRPNSATPLSTLLGDCGCGVSFDFVPDKRVEG